MTLYDDSENKERKWNPTTGTATDVVCIDCKKVVRVKSQDYFDDHTCQVCNQFVCDRCVRPHSKAECFVNLKILDDWNWLNQLRSKQV